MMRKLLFTLELILSLTLCSNLAAQLPSPSTASNPKWYYIQVIGTSTTLNLVATVVGDNVVGKPLNTGDMNVLSSQLWRFEMRTSGTSGYAIFNKSTGKQLSVTYNQTQNQRVAVVSDNSSTLWRFVRQTSDDGYVIRLASETGLQGTSGDIYLYQLPLAQNYGVVLTGTANNTGPNATFNFVLNQIPIISAPGNTVVWMYIQNAKSGKYITDAVASPQDQAYFILSDLKTGGAETSQQWKLTKNVNNRIVFTNRATGNIISSESVFDRYYYLQFANNQDIGDGWNLDPLASNQYAIYTTNTDGVVKYWYETTPGMPTNSYLKDYANNSPYAWLFSWAAEESPTGIQNPPALPDDIRVYSYNKRIYVEGCNDYKIITVYGTPVNQNSSLPVGVYLVITKNGTTKVLVK